MVASVTAASTTSVSFGVPSNANVSSTQSFTFTPPSSGGGGGTAAWTSRASPNSFILNGLSYGSGKFVAVGFNRVIVTSTDGLVWSTQAASDTAFYQGNAVIWDDAQFVMVGDKNFGAAQPPLIATSPDGVTWTRRALTATEAPAGFKPQAVMAVGSTLSAVGDNGQTKHIVVSSTDGGATGTQDCEGTTTGQAVQNGLASSGSRAVAVGGVEMLTLP